MAFTKPTDGKPKQAPQRPNTTKNITKGAHHAPNNESTKQHRIESGEKTDSPYKPPQKRTSGGAEKERGPRVNRPFFGRIFRKVTPAERSADGLLSVKKM